MIIIRVVVLMKRLISRVEKRCPCGGTHNAVKVKGQNFGERLEAGEGLAAIS